MYLRALRRIRRRNEILDRIVLGGYVLAIGLALVVVLLWR
jgi:hypothetical protein